MNDKYLIVAILYNLELEKNTTFDFLGWTISNDLKGLEKMMPDQKYFLMGIGGGRYLELEEKSFAYKTYTLKEDEENERILTKNEYNLSVALSLIWLYKDNSITIAEIFYHSYSNGDIRFGHSDRTISDAKGNLTPLSINDSFKEKIKEYNLSAFLKPLIFIPEKNRKDLYSNMSRTQNAYSLLETARSTPFLPMKIAFYVDVLECLVVSESNELRYRLMINTAYFIENEKDKRDEVGKTVEDAYKVRSALFHGLTIKSKIDDLEEMSYKLDDIVRRVLLKAVIKQDIFNAKVTSSKNLVKDYFRSLLFT